ncbi:ABC transporter substrate-binding protein [Cohnella sp.]|uniref:ABC transporter substrate-binding protein n=1 Tax=Cohnella sp. TaxID=1883426 RepID=UPI003564B5DF
MFLGSARKSVLILVGLVVMSLWLGACGNNEANITPAATSAAKPAEETVSPSASASASSEAAVEKTLTDGVGNEVKIPANPQRIIAAYLEDHLIALGIKPVAQWSVANGVQDYLIEGLNGVPNIPYDLPFEAVTSFEPDLIIMGSGANVEGDKYKQYSQIAPTYTIGDQINNDWRQALLKIGEVLNKSEEAQKVLNDYEVKAAAAKEKLTNAVGTQSAAAVWLVQKNFFIVSEKLSSGAVLYKDLGMAIPKIVEEISKTSESNWNPISLEQLALLDADHLFLINSDVSTGSESLKDPVWQGIPAVKNGNLYEYSNTTSWLYTGTIANSQIIDDVLESVVK